MNFKTYLEQSWHLTKDNVVMLVLITLVMGLLSTVTLGILAPVTFAGYTYSLLLLIREDREPRIQDLFSQMRLFFPLLVFSLLSIILVGIGFLLLFVPGIIIGIAISFFCLYMIPCMVDQQLDLVDAVKNSIQIINQNIMEHAIAALIYIGLGWLGSLVAVGWLITFPFGTVFILLVYNDIYLID